MELQGIGLQEWDFCCTGLQIWNSKILGYISGIEGYWTGELELQGVGLQDWDFRVLDHKSGISGYWITSPTGAASASVNFI